MPSGEVPYDWVDERVRQAAPPGRPSQWLVVESGLLITAVFLLAYILYEAQFSGTVRWALGSAIIAAVALYAWWAVTRRTAEPAPLAVRAAAAPFRTGELTTLLAAVRRANGGLVFSQVAVSSRVREAFAVQTSLARGLSREEMRRLEHDRSALRSTLHDPVLEDFLYLSSTDHDERYRWVREARDHGGFKAALQTVLDRMEAWR